jgi:methylated-DNA-protein-cysteine methyltransferase-like protein
MLPARFAYRFFRFVSSLFRGRVFLAAASTLLNTVPAIFSCSLAPIRPSIPTAFFGALRVSWDPVYRLVRQIPRGRVLTYGALAKAIRLPGGARSAGRAMAATPAGTGIPWHRVVGERGKILIRGPHAMLQKKLLESEGVAMIESRVKLDAHAWKPPAAKSSRKTKRK